MEQAQVQSPVQSRVPVRGKQRVLNYPRKRERERGFHFCVRRHQVLWKLLVWYPTAVS
jgi:CII-binding regulator of phage lambda lysogenization HflD